MHEQPASSTVITAPIDVYMIDLWTKTAEVLNPRPAEITGVAALQGPFSYPALHAFCCPIQNICGNPAGKACPQKPPSRSSGRHQIIPAITVHILRFSPPPPNNTNGVQTLTFPETVGSQPRITAVLDAASAHFTSGKRVATGFRNNPAVTGRQNLAALPVRHIHYRLNKESNDDK